MPNLYHAAICGNVYLADSATCYALRVEGKLTKSDIVLVGENPGGKRTAQAVYIGENAEFSRNTCHFSFGKAGYTRHAAAGWFIRNQIVRFDSVSGDVFRESNLRDFPSR